ncbi:hypothetical protein VP01_1660g10 [Puccinia sorghi]|uniref:Uncharacterized protein n=1 Tax=Puccinia sorghi TaxID=27349 RepID=A0A0L6VGC1_9BASI|nr:hypothetical protein VP01_1660g10 [Puccinia sorghi]
MKTPKGDQRNPDFDMIEVDLSLCATPDNPEDDIYAFSLTHAEPVISHISLLATMLSLLGDSSHSTSSWFLKSARDLLKNVISNPIGALTTRQLHYQEEKAIKLLPTDICTVIKWLQIDPLLVQLVCCPKCFALYLHNSDTPQHCVHQSFPSLEEDESATSNSPDNTDPGPEICGAELLQSTKNGLTPVRMLLTFNIRKYGGSFSDPMAPSSQAKLVISHLGCLWMVSIPTAVDKLESIATRMCSYCLLEKSKINNLNPQTWPMRTTTDHKHWAIHSRDAQDQNTRKKILKKQGVRYSVMLELPYWDIIKYHVVDSMHNLLLGLLKWHCQRFWCMADIDDEESPKAIPTTELMDLLAEVSSIHPAPNAPASPGRIETESTSTGVPLDRTEFRSNESSDDTFLPSLGDEGWGGPWTPPRDGKIILDRDMLLFINRLLPRIRVPTSIKRAIPILGKASFGRLKADEWRNLFTIQLPLTLPVYWAEGGSTGRSLFCNFAHLVSSVNLALKRSISSNEVSQYRYHNLEYLKSSLILFPKVTLVPNHHMSVHLADCLDKFGPSRGWWSFSMERLMGSILKSSHNNRLGQLEISFLVNFCRVGNLQALITQSDKFPPKLHPFLHQLQALYFKNLLSPPRNLIESKYFLPLDSVIEKHVTYSVDDLTYCNFDNNLSNSLIALKSSCEIQYGVILKIFTHMRALPDQSNPLDTWLVIHPLVSFDTSSKSNPFLKLEQFQLRLALRTIDRKNKHLIHISEVLAQCAWIKYRALEISPHKIQESIALVVLDR